MALRKLWFVAIVLAGIFAGGSAMAAIGIFNWSATADETNTSAAINYRLNSDAESGTIAIKEAVSGTVVKTLTLSTAQLTKGPHTVTWTGDIDPSGRAATGDYKAEISVTAAAINTTDPNYGPGQLIMIKDLSIPTTNPSFYGIAADTNPANPTYGQIYIANSSTRNIEVYYADGTLKTTFSTGLTGISAPWGIAVGVRGRVYTFDKSSQRAVSFNPDGTDKKSVAIPATPIGANPFVVPDGSGANDQWLYFCDGSTSSSSGNGIRRIGIDSNYNFTDLSTRVLDISTGQPFGVVLNADQSRMYVANYSLNYGNLTTGLECYNNSGSAWVKDTTFTSPLPNTADGLGINPGGDLYAVMSLNSRNLVRINPSTGAYIDANSGYKVAPNGVVSVSSDARGNALFNGYTLGSANRTAKQMWAGMFLFPDSGSSDTRTTNTFHIVQSFQKPYLESAALTPASIPADGTTSSSLSGTAIDNDGLSEGAASSIVTATIDLSSLGGNAATPLTITRDPDNIHFGLSLSGITAAPGTSAGVHHLPIRLVDNHDMTNEGITTPPQTVDITITGGSIRGYVKNDATNLQISSVVKVKAEDTASLISYTVDSAVDGSFTLQTHAGTFVVTAYSDPADLTKVQYKQGTPASNVVVVSNQETTGVTPGVRPLTITEAKALYAGVTAPAAVPVCVRGVCDGQRARIETFTYGFSTNFYLREKDAGQTGTRNGIRIAFDSGGVMQNQYPAEGDDIVVVGSLKMNTGYVLQVQDLTAYNRVGQGVQYGAPDPITITGFNNDSGADIDPDWGRLFKVSGVTVTQHDTVNLRFRVSDGSNLGWIHVLDTTGVSTDEFPPIGKLVNITGLKDRLGALDVNCLRIRKQADIEDAYRSYSTTGSFVKYGWNLVAVPANPVNADPLVVFNAIDVPNASFQYWNNNIEGGGFRLYGAGWTGPVLRGVPYWFMELGSPKDISYLGYPPSEDFTMTIPARTNAPFWIMFGTPFPSQVACANVQFLNTAVSATPKNWADAAAANMVESKALGFDASLARFFTAGDASFMPERTELQPWFGYWLLINRPEQLTITFPKP